MNQKRKFGFKPVKTELNKRVKTILDPKFSKAKFTDDLIKTVIKKAAEERQQNLVNEIVKRLNTLGFTFENDEETKEFFKDRLKIAQVDGNNYVYLDYVDNDNQGTLIIWYSENMEIEVKTEMNDRPTLTIN